MRFAVGRRSRMIVAALVLLPFGCRHRCGDCGSSSRLRDRLGENPRDKPSGRGMLPDSLGEPIPPRSIPTTPAFDPAQPLPPATRQYVPIKPFVPADPLPPYRSNKELLLPDGAAPPKSQSNYAPSAGYLLDPIVAASPAEARNETLQPPIVPPKQMPGPGDPPDSIPDRPAEPAAGVPGFTNVSAGRKPQPDGLRALKAKGFTAFAYLHAPGDDVSATRELAEKAGLKFRALAVTPETLKVDSDAFRELVHDSDLRPLYVADDDGVRVGSLWYVYFRSEGQDAERAKAKAAKLGLKDADDTETQKRFWVAINGLLANR